MMNRWAIPLVFVIVAFIGVACGSSPAASQDSAPPSEPERVDPTATPDTRSYVLAETAGSYRHADTQPYAPARPYCYPGD